MGNPYQENEIAMTTTLNRLAKEFGVSPWRIAELLELENMPNTPISDKQLGCFLGWLVFYKAGY